MLCAFMQKPQALIFYLTFNVSYRTFKWGSSPLVQALIHFVVMTTRVQQHRLAILPIRSYWRQVPCPLLPPPHTTTPSSRTLVQHLETHSIYTLRVMYPALCCMNNTSSSLIPRPPPGIPPLAVILMMSR